jgi:XTP/dITP diphosphohydrolase
VLAKTRIGYCDGRRIHQFEGEISGRLSPQPQGNRDFQWDCVFVPDGSSQTFAEMGEDAKNAISMRRKALDVFAEYLRTSTRA